MNLDRMLLEVQQFFVFLESIVLVGIMTGLIVVPTAAIIVSLTDRRRGGR